MTRRWLLAGMVALGCAAAPAPASALRYERCDRVDGAPRDARCATLVLPLDRSGAIAGTVPLRIARIAARAPTGARKALVYLSGGPGGAGIEEFGYAVGDVRFLARRYDLIGFDQRGTGASGLLRCPELERDKRLRSTRAAARCAARIGPRRALYTTATTVEDLEALRAAVGAEQLILLGVSYGTEVALAYARAHPDRVERMILDSVVDPDATDPFALASYHGVAKSMRDLCPSRCRGLTRDPAADVTRLVAALRAQPLRGHQIRPTGRRVARTLKAQDLLDLVFDSDYLPSVRGAMPAAVRAALAGDAAPLLRLLAFTAPINDTGPVRSFAAGRYATVCEEAALPWPRGTAFDQRLGAATALAAGLPPGSFAPFDFDLIRKDTIDLCLHWPEAPVAPVVPVAPYPTVPTLILQGGEDLRTPREVSARVAAAIGDSAARVVAPGVGHAVLANAYGGCARRALRAWAAGRSVRSSCPRQDTLLPPLAPPPRSLGELRPAGGLRGKAGRTFTAVQLTLADLLVSTLLSPASRVGGLRGGSYRASEVVITLDRLEYVPGVWVSGRLGDSARLTIAGPAAARGRLTVGTAGVRGTLGGRRVDARPASLSSVLSRSPAPARPAAVRGSARSAR